MPHREPVARRMFELTEPICLVNFFSEEPNEAMVALGLRDNYWDGYFAGRSAPLGRVPAEVVHAAFYNFGDGEAARHIPRVWEMTTPEAAHAARQQGCVQALRRILVDLVETPGLARAAELLARASTSASSSARLNSPLSTFPKNGPFTLPVASESARAAISSVPISREKNATPWPASAVARNDDTAKALLPIPGRPAMT